MSCASCTNCKCGADKEQYVNLVECKSPGCTAIVNDPNKAKGESNKDVDENDEWRYQSADAPVHDPEATNKLRLKLEKKITDKYPDNPLRPKLVTAINGRKCLVWGAPHKYPSHRLGLGLVKGSHVTQVVKVYENEKKKDEKGVEHGRFLHINTGKAISDD